LNDVECASKSGKIDNLSPENIEKNIDLIISSGHILKLAENNTELLIKKGYKDFIIETDWRLKTVYEDIEKFKIESLESDANLLKAISNNSDDIKSSVWKLEEISQNDHLNRTVQEVEEKSLKLEENCVKAKLELIENNDKTLVAHLESVKDLKKMLLLQFSEAKVLMENERLQCKLRETEYTKALELRDAKYINDKQAVDFELKTLKQEIAELKAELKINKEHADCAATLK
jgi:hypothetical protein